jgi:hypothetical protein
MDAAELRRAYGVFLTEVETGGFGAPPPGEWTADQLVAHIATNDELLVEATEAVVAGSPFAYYNHNAIHTPQLNELVAECGGLAGVTDRVRSSSRRLCDLVDQLGAKSSTPVDTNIRDGEIIDIDEPLPWGRLIDIHARIHLPAHTNQLRSLRPTTAAPSA